MGDYSYSTEQTASGNGLTVHQRYAPEHFARPSVAIKLENDRTEPVHVRLSVPAVDADSVEFHPEFESERWSAADAGLRFEAEVPPESDVTTLYAVEADDPATFHRAIDSLVVESVEAVDGDGVTGALSGVAGDLTLETTDEAVVETDSPDSSHDSVAEKEEARPVADGAGTTDPSRAESQLADRATDELVAELADRLERESLTQSQRDRLASLDLGADRNGAQAERIAHLQARVSDVETFTDSIADLSEEYGSPAAAFAAMEERLDALEAFEERLAAVEEAAGDLEATEERLTELGETVESTVDRLGAVEPRLDSVEESVTTVDDTVEDLENSVDDVAATVADVDHQVDGIEETVTGVDDRVDGVEETVTDIEGTVDDVADEVEAATAEVAELDDTVETVESAMADVETNVENLDGRTLAIEGDLRAVEDWITGLEDELEVLGRDQSEMEAGIETLAETVEGLDDRQAATETTLETVQNDVESLATDQAAIESDIEDIETWREKVTGALDAFRGQ